MASPLTPKQWEAIRKRFLAGEKARPLGREFGVSETAIRKRFGVQTKEIKKVANQLVAAEEAFLSLSISSQISARTLADELRAVSIHLAGAGKFGAMTSHRLSGIANKQVDMIDDVNPMASRDVLEGIAVLTKMANDSSVIGCNLLKANKEAIDTMNKPETKTPAAIMTRVVDNGR